MSWAHSGVLFWSKGRCFTCKNQRKGLGQLETSNSDTNHAVLHEQNDRCGMGPRETSYSGPKVALLQAKTTVVGWDP